MEKAILVKAKGKKATAVVTPKSKVQVASDSELENDILQGVTEVENLLTGKAENPLKKKCSRCVKMGRVPYHNLDQFSVLKNGKLHSQCKVCRVEQSDEWCRKRAEHRKEYHREYHKTRVYKPKTPTPIKILRDARLAEEEAEKPVTTLDTLFVAFTESNIKDTKEG